MVNNPAEVRNAPEKLFVTGFPGLQPPTLISADAEALHDFHASHGDMVLKPLYGGARLRRGAAEGRTTPTSTPCWSCTR